MRRLFLLFLLLIAGAGIGAPASALPAAAQPARAVPAVQPDWRRAVEEQVLVQIGGYQPDPLRLEAGRPTRLVFYNNTRARLSFDAGSFFANSYIRSGDDQLVRDGGMVLEPGETRAVALVPSAGRYRIRSRSWLRRLIGVSATIIVEPTQRSEGRGID